MKILLIKPSYKNIFSSGISQPLGLTYLASSIRKMRPSRDEIHIVDLRSLSNASMEAISTIISDYGPNVIGISCLTVEASMMASIAKCAKKIMPSVIVVAGGPHATAYPEETLTDSNIDYAVFGEGEESFCELINCIEASEEPHKVQSVGFVKDGKMVFTLCRMNFSDVNALPYPAWDLLDLEFYYTQKSMSALSPRRYMALFTSRGCPYKCIYCHNIFGKNYRARDVENILGELRILKEKYGIYEFEIVDDCFNLNKRRAKDFFERLIAEKFDIKISFPTGVRIDLLDEELISLMKEGGVDHLACPIETASPRLQDLIGKKLDLNKARHMIEFAGKKKIFLSGFFMMGFPTETESELRQTIQFAVSSSLCQALFATVMPYKNTMIQKMFYPDATLPESMLQEVAKETFFTASINLSTIPEKRFYSLRRFAYMRFYFSLKRVYLFLSSCPRTRLKIIYGGIKTVISIILYITMMQHIRTSKRHSLMNQKRG